MLSCPAPSTPAELARVQGSFVSVIQLTKDARALSPSTWQKLVIDLQVCVFGCGAAVCLQYAGSQQARWHAAARTPQTGVVCEADLLPPIHTHTLFQTCLKSLTTGARPACSCVCCRNPQQPSQRSVCLNTDSLQAVCGPDKRTRESTGQQRGVGVWKGVVAAAPPLRRPAAAATAHASRSRRPGSICRWQQQYGHRWQQQEEQQWRRQWQRFWRPRQQQHLAA